MPKAEEAGFDFSQEIHALIGNLKLKTPVYLDGSGAWQENPGSLEQCASHEVLFQCWKLSKTQNISFFNDTLYILGTDFPLRGLKRTASALDKYAADQKSSESRSSSVTSEAFLMVFRLLTWALAGKALDLNRKRSVPDWNLTAQSENKDVRPEAPKPKRNSSVTAISRKRTGSACQFV